MILKKLVKFFIVLLFALIVCAFSYREYQEVKLIYIDPGHGGIDGGCISNDGVYEKEIVLKIAYRLKEYLQLNGYRVLFTRDDDYDLASDWATNRKKEDILKRVSIINDSKAVACISIHANAFPDNRVSGAQVFYGNGNEKSKELSEFVQFELDKNIDNNRQELKIKDKFILDNVNCPSIIVEVGFLSNVVEAQKLQEDNYQMVVAYAIGKGVDEFINEK